ncbi:3-methyl-2-oxobutanoate hydroxymethyltransferase [Gracilibacillus halophilus YIM-C55.5]|uniref:3-methyl-2-oxobutanoate hydroxymethyltransferase n=1 Tax=Gracilibacillus halophilus YIM-C55.5 TaxID=1308866 RepID=N4WDI1_9BACI|nr:3-methyl-2-oxobutanoate hydroxymethyltransferase [Gracilibacillus halophilus]ENH97319.1 3-methyl-2-oxobutanoate hydroxymethyltransferase [Gracilibacillus halophilus YIM-C55.5]
MKTSVQLQKMKQQNEKITMVTAYDYPSARLAESSGIDMILVGDSLGNVVLGYDSTIQVTVEDMVHHGKAVKRGAPDTFIVVDMPFMSYHISVEEGMRQAQYMMQQTNAHALKVEGASNHTLQLIQRLTEAGVPVIGHIGLTPQSVHVLGGYRVQGKDKQTALALIEDAKKLETSGAIQVVLECVPNELASHISSQLSIPTIGIGAGKKCDGQVLVYHDLLTYGADDSPSFVQQYADVNHIIQSALSQFDRDVKEQNFPNQEQSFVMDKTLVQDLKLEDS